jgi:rRNA maturation protein Nop10
MAHIEPALPFDHFSGKLSRKERIVMRTRNGRTHAYAVTNPYTGPLAESRKRAISTFSQAVTRCKTEMSAPERLAYWQDRYIRYRKAATRHVERANAKFLGTTSDKFYSTLRGFIIASISAQLTQNS